MASAGLAAEPQSVVQLQSVSGPQSVSEPQSAGEPQSVGEALRQGRAVVNLRFRYEGVDDDRFTRNAHAFTLRTTLGYETGRFQGFGAFLEAENVAPVDGDLYANAGFGDRNNGVTDRPVVADPSGTAMLQGYLSYVAGETTVRLGRQVLAIDDQRFVGPVGWRQHFQSFDALSIVNRSLPATTLTYAYLDEVHRVTRESRGIAGHLLNAAYAIEGWGRVIGYAYLLDFDESRFARSSTATFGVEIGGARRIHPDVTLLGQVELAEQRDFGDNPNDVDIGYLHLMAGAAARQFTLRAGWERLGGNAADGQFNTPLATLHLFSGWADQFLTTPTQGLEDLYFRLDGPAGPLRWTAVYHLFHAAAADEHYGDEVDVQLVYAAPWEQSFGFKLARYDADRFSNDAAKVMVWSAYRF